MSARHILTASIVLLAAACGGSDDNPGAGGSTGQGGNTGGTTSAGGAGGEGGQGGAGGMIPPEPVYRATISGDITWNVTFDAEAQMNGATDCAYTRHYEGVQDDSVKWYCPDCDVIYRADVEMTMGQADCFSQISAGQPRPVEWIGFANGVFRRGVGMRMTEQGTAMDDGTSIATANLVTDLEFTAGGLFGFDVAGVFTEGEEEGDPLEGWHVADTYSCGWPKADPPPYTGDYTLVQGATLPDGLFKDSCDEVVRLHDFAGSYMVVDMSAIDCPPCQQLASQEEAFVASLAAQGIEVHVITLLAPSLADTLGETTQPMLANWENTYALESPVLADRGWGLSMFLDVFDGGSYPSFVIVAPDLSMIQWAAGFGGWGEIETVIADHALANP